VLKGVAVPRTSTETLPRCRQCGAPLVPGKRRRTCPRCHPAEIAGEAQLEFSLGAPHLNAAPLSEEPLDREEIAAPLPLPMPVVKVEPVNPSGGFLPIRPRWTATRFLIVAAGSLIVLGGIVWAAFQLWPHGPVERAIVEQLEAMPHFAERTGVDNPFANISVEGDSTPTLIDLTGRGLLDLVTGSRSGEIRIFRNVGTRTRPRFASAASDTLGLAPTDTSNAIAFAALHTPGLPDALNAGTNGAPTFFRNRGNRPRPDFLLLAPEADPFAAAALPPRSLDWRCTFADLDHDGDADLIVGTRDGTVLYFENRGTAQKPQFRGVTRVAPFGLRGLGELVSLTFGDLDGDGDLDAIAGNAAGDLLFLLNRGNAWRPQFVITPRGTLGLPTVGPDATVALADLDGDGDLDLIVGGRDGHFRYFENLSTPAPSSPAK
jgi:hypothetical protein